MDTVPQNVCPGCGYPVRVDEHAPDCPVKKASVAEEKSLPVASDSIKEDVSDKPEVARSRRELPPLKEGFVRLVHITTREQAQDVAVSGLNYEKYGMLMSTARAFTSESEVKYETDDPRFNFEGATVVVTDVPVQEYKLHNDVAKSPGVVPAEYVVGIFELALKERQQDGE